MMNKKLNIEPDTQNQDLQSKSDFEPVVIPPTNSFENIDCMEMLRKCPPKHFDLAIVDPPYGIGMGKVAKWTTSKKCLAEPNNYKTGDWDASPPPPEYFEELFRVSKNQIIWGGNFYELGKTSCWVVWDKENDGTYTADFEMAWTSFNKATRIFRYMWRGFLQGGEREEKIHIAQKPVALYRWLLKNYAASGDLILDTHVGSGSSIIACIEGGFNYYGCEIDKDYYEAAKKRIGRAFRKYELEFGNEAV